MECKFIWSQLDRSVQNLSNSLRAKAVTAEYDNVIALLDTQPKTFWRFLPQKIENIKAAVALYLAHAADAEAQDKLDELGKTYFFNMPGRLVLLCEAIDLLN